MAVIVHGTCEPAFATVADELERNLVERGEVGAAVAAHVDGRLVVDLWAGLADAATGRPWERDTIAHAGIRGPGLAAGFGYITCALAGYDRADACADAFEAALAGRQRPGTRV
jgi:hypothetical protein